MNINCNSCDGVYADSLDVRFTKACDNNCPWCIERHGVAGRGRPDPLVLANATILSGKRTVLILGGEPFLEPAALAQYVELIRPHVDRVYITTSVPRTLDLADVDVQHVLRLIDGLNVSLHSVDWLVNNIVLKASDQTFNRVARLEQILETYADKVRVSVNLAVGSVDSRAAVVNYIETLADIGCVHVKLSELQDAPGDYVSFDELFPELKLRSPFAHGCQTEVNVGQPRWVKVTVKRSCFVVGPGDATVRDLVKVVGRRLLGSRGHQTVLYENGELSNGWLVEREGGDCR